MQRCKHDKPIKLTLLGRCSTLLPSSNGTLPNPIEEQGNTSALYSRYFAAGDMFRSANPLQVTAQTDGQKATFLSQWILAICVTNHIGRCRG